jgi:hypothetical protein
VVAAADRAELGVHDDAGLDDLAVADAPALDRDPVQLRPVGDPVGGVAQLRLRPRLLGGEPDLLDAERERVVAGDVPRLAVVGHEAGVVALRVVGGVRGRLHRSRVEEVAEADQVTDAGQVRALRVMQSDQQRLRAVTARLVAAEVPHFRAWSHLATPSL